MGPQIRAQTDHVVLSDEYKSGTNILDDEKDIIEYHLWEAEKGSIDSLIAIGVICYQVPSSLSPYLTAPPLPPPTFDLLCFPQSRRN